MTRITPLRPSHLLHPPLYLQASIRVHLRSSYFLTGRIGRCLSEKKERERLNMFDYLLVYLLVYRRKRSRV